MAMGPSGQLYVSSRFEGSVFRVAPDGTAELFATDLGVACGLAFGLDGMLYVGDRLGTIFRVDPDGRAAAWAELPASVAAFHLAMSPHGVLFATAPTLSACDALYEIAPDGTVSTRYARFGRPQGLAFDATGALFVVEALAGGSGLYRVPVQGDPELVLSGPGLVGVAFDLFGATVVASNDTAYRLPRTAP
jgi:sugar lactone lactonase YvrE